MGNWYGLEGSGKNGEEREREASNSEHGPPFMCWRWHRRWPFYRCQQGPRWLFAALTTRPLLFMPLLPSIFFRLLSVEKREQLILPLGFRHWARRAIDVRVALSTFWSRAASPLDCHQFTRVLNDCGCSALLSDLRLQLDLPTENTTLGSRRRQYLPGDARVRVGN